MAKDWKNLKDRMMECPPEMFSVLTFEELKEGDKFICFPMPGDNSGHGGFLGAHYIFLKLPKRRDLKDSTAVLLSSGLPVDFPDGLLVLKVE